MIRNYILVSFLVILSTKLIAQQDALFMQYMDNQIYVNPAFTGSKEQMNLNLLHRQQWVGFNGAPMTTTFSIHTPSKYESVGLGLDFNNDRVGPMNRTSFSGNFAYRIKISDKSKLSLGLKAGMDSYTSRFSSIECSEFDPNLQSYQNIIKPHFGLGMYYFAPNWFIGTSMPRITKSSECQLNINARHLFIIGGFLKKINKQLDLRTSLQIRIVENGPLSSDLTLTGIFKNKFWLGATYRNRDAAGIFVQYAISDKFKFGYGFDFQTNGLSKVSYGSHELLLSIDIIKNKKNLTSPRYFN